ncbi:hypothetical protein O3P69_004229 [Scylla paramamosain]|uniref:Uncharacterized protein n=1 Tax=Scylla paramamosain TaxID=85552 RepID=A0AAW0UJX2_SCYPA
MMEDFEELHLHDAATPTHTGGGRLDLTLTVNGNDCIQNVNGIPELLSDHWAQEYGIHLQRSTHLPNITRKREQIKTICEEKWLENMGKLSHDTSMTQVWKEVNRVRGKHTKHPRHPDPAGKASELMREYRERAAKPTREAGVAAAVRPADDTDAPIMREELLGARKTSRDTAPGVDGITHSMLNAGCNVTGDPLLHLYNMSLTGNTP